MCSSHLFWEHLRLFTRSSRLWLQPLSATNLLLTISSLSKLLLCSSRQQQLLQQHYSRSVTDSRVVHCTVSSVFKCHSLIDNNPSYVKCLVSDHHCPPAVSATTTAAPTTTATATPTAAPPTATIQCSSSGKCIKFTCSKDGVHWQNESYLRPLFVTLCKNVIPPEALLTK